MTDFLYLVCPKCHGVNKIPKEKLDKGGKCGKCRHILVDGEVIEAGSGNFSRHISRNSLPVVVDFWAPWCGPCKMMAPVFSQAAHGFRHQFRFVKVNTENEQAIAAQYHIRSIPTLAIFKAGQEITRQAGAMDFNALSQFLSQHININK